MHGAETCVHVLTQKMSLKFKCNFSFIFYSIMPSHANFLLIIGYFAGILNYFLYKRKGNCLHFFCFQSEVIFCCFRFLLNSNGHSFCACTNRHSPIIAQSPLTKCRSADVSVIVHFVLVILFVILTTSKTITMNSCVCCSAFLVVTLSQVACGQIVFCGRSV